MAKGKRREADPSAGDDMASADTVAVADSRDPAGAVPTVRRARRGDDGEDTTREPGLQLRPGDEVARFTVVEKVGEGGMAAVYAAYDPRLDRRVALKVMRPDAAEQETPKQGRRRLLREAQALARLSHPNVVVVHEVDEVQGQVYVAMEYVEGGNLRAWQRRARRAWREIVEIYCRAGRGLAAAHRAGLVHRDFKPENVLVGDDGRVRVTDFGLVGTTDALAESTPPMDRRGRFPTGVPLSSETEARSVIMGTPGYVAPELYRGLPADERSDQFAFCVSLFEALYDEKPFLGETVAEMAASMIDGRTRPAPQHSDVPVWVAGVLERGLASDPAQRYGSMDELVAALESDPVAARRKRLRAVGAAIGFAALGALAVIGFLRTAGDADKPCADVGRKMTQAWNPTRKQEMRAALAATGLAYAADTYRRVVQALDAYADEWTAMRTEACEATHLRGEQSEAVLDARMWCLDRRQGELDAFVDLLTSDADRTVVEHAVHGANSLIEIDTCADVEALTNRVPLPDDPDVLADARRLSSQIDRVAVLSRAGLTREALALSESLVERARANGWSHIIARAMYEHAMLLEATGSAEASERTLREALPLAAEAKNDALVAAIYIELLYAIGQDQSRVEEALHLGTSAEAALTRAGNPVTLRARYRSQVGSIYDLNGRYQEALSHYRAALGIYREAHDEGHPYVAEVLNNVAVMLDLLGQRDEAQKAYRRVLASEEANFGPGHPRVARTLNNLAIVLVDRGDLDEAIAHYERALEIWRQAYGEEHEMVGITLVNIGVALQEKGERSRARQAFESALKIWERAQGRSRAHLATTLANLGDLYEKDGDCERALGHYRRSLEINEDVLGPDHPDLAYALMGIGSCYLASERPGDAIPPLERALALRTTHEVDATEVAETQFRLARALWHRRNDRNRARTLALQARDTLRAAGETDSALSRELEAWMQKRKWAGDNRPTSP